MKSLDVSTTITGAAIEDYRQEISILDDEQLRLRAVTCFILRISEKLSMLRQEAETRSIGWLADHIAELERKVQYGAN
jgi:HPt (histidine-containing phosphotransfer) domain-containing protein